jgi:hypothetical protein
MHTSIAEIRDVYPESRMSNPDFFYITAVGSRIQDPTTKKEEKKIHCLI